MSHINHLWRHPPESLALAYDEVHVWRASLDLAAEQIQGLYDVLVPDERAKAERFHFQKDRVHFIAARGVLRDILSRYLGLGPSQVRFRYSPYGKPALMGESGEERLRFNLAHSYGLALYAVAWGREVGIDVEYIRADLASELIARQFFSLREVAVLRSLSKTTQIEAFFNCWTRKEAYIKARGQGLSLPLDEFDVSLVPGEAARLESTRADLHEASRWSLCELSPGSGYVAAIAVEGHSWSLKCWQWPGGPVA